MKQFIDWIQQSTPSKSAENFSISEWLHSFSPEQVFDMIKGPLLNGGKIILLLLLGWLFAKFVGRMIGRILKAVKFDDLAEKVQAKQMLQKANISEEPSKLLGRFFYYIILLFIFVTLADKMGWSGVSTQINKLIDFLPSVLTGVFMFFVGYYISNFIREIIRISSISLGFKGGKVIGNFLFYFLMIMVTIMVLDHLKIDTKIITNILILSIGAMLLAAGISYGFSSRIIMRNLLASFFTRKTFKEGQVIRIDDIEGQILKIEGILVTLQTPLEKVVIPTQELINKKVYIVKDVE